MNQGRGVADTGLVARLFADAVATKAIAPFGPRAQVREAIARGESAFKKWREFFGADALDVAQALDIHPEDYRRIEINAFVSTPGDVRAFCRYFKLSPLDLVDDYDVMPTGVAVALAERAGDRFLNARKRMRAQDAILAEIEKTVAIFGQERLYLNEVRAGRVRLTDMALPRRAFGALTLDNPLARLVGGYGDTLSLIEDCAQDDEVLLGEAEDTLARAGGREWKSLQERWMQRMLAFFARMECEDEDVAGPLIEDSIETVGLAHTRATFIDEPGRFGIERWHVPHVINGQVYGWESGCHAFFDALEHWRGNQSLHTLMQEQRAVANSRLRELDAWAERAQTQDLIQGFSNICVFARLCDDDARVVRALEPFYARPAARVFGPQGMRIT
ncbi:MAG: helix-turn-helix transcriptional regulator [Rhodospirillales bacterium]|nr:helix-turn-helix transcriptional regulator [Alphaproteobacteria bacterium]MCB9987234.1 helix-turn-helix transcriptional regulator [Rhodospirillales bacterium]USO07905.1 MAG: helix-turn-helix transcriptional regulator [Rhodospirillales bacterium]